MARAMAVALTLILAWTALGTPGATRGDLEPMVRELLRMRVEQADLGGLRAGSGRLHAVITLPLLYEERLFRPIWLADGQLRPQVQELVQAIRDAHREGLEPEDYHLRALDTLLPLIDQKAGDEALRAAALADLDLLLSDAFLVLAAHIVSGRVRPDTFDPEWLAVNREVDLEPVLAAVLDGGSVTGALASLLPADPGYARLRDALARYREIANGQGWAPVADGPALRPGGSETRVLELRRRLAATGDLDGPSAAEPEAFDEHLERAVHRFQARHGLEVDGVVGAKTLAALNIPPRARVRQLELNLERWRWLPRELGPRHILVNIPDFELAAVEDGRTALEMRVVVGLSYRRTPVFSDLMRYLVLNPYWEIPPTLAVQDKLPLIRKDPEYLAQQGIRVLQGWGIEEREVDPGTVDWAALRGRGFPYRLRQDPGPRNALGRIKFMFPNRFNVYLHDTPTRELFARADRDLSSGCIRVENPVDLAEYLLREAPGWSRAAILAAIGDGGPTQTVPLPRPIPVHLLYWTAWADAEGTVQFRRDLYGRDELLDEALRRAREPSAGGLVLETRKS